MEHHVMKYLESRHKSQADCSEWSACSSGHFKRSKTPGYYVDRICIPGVCLEAAKNKKCLHCW